MSAHTKVLPIKDICYIDVIFGLPGKKTLVYRIPNVSRCKEKLTHLLETLGDPTEPFLTPWDKAIPWEAVAHERIKKYKRAGLVLRGARLREGFSQKDLANKCQISQDNLSRIENGKRVVGEKVAKRLAEALKIDYRLLLSNSN